MKLKVLGSGSSGNCYVLQNEKETLIIECGLPYKTILKGLNFNLISVVGCLVTHEHKDHSKAISEVLNNGIDVYTSQGTMKEYLQQEYALNMNYRFKLIKSREQFNIGNFIVLPFKVQHDVAEPLGFLIHHKEFGKLLFITDSYYCQYEFNGLIHIMIECNYSSEILENNFKKGVTHNSLRDRLLKSHFSLEHVKEFLKETDLRQVKEITLLHLSDSNSNDLEFKEEIEKLTGIPTYIADKGLELEL
ncbi:Phosphoribosyl 1,2-cyclic phosphodiesterase [Clostridium acidisoli DSM 12555]|uniref:Phosphoribosyl 1,2-cyclic phosphodiesterase n=1 Tax=Clostridium acidisoli DSM 12555 TaxID=1121291 RepID=A0A1W1X070_9CLOT|nr:MBL fold metallo-hydrolase [Clostridium acidisoli]SMC17294.1 Phosphoribosyl 1,2-cyclic phosphodiesterase [Clostridium acidisoli DSM 12555]